MNTNNDVKWRRFIVPKKVKQINDYLFIDTNLFVWPLLSFGTQYPSQSVHLSPSTTSNAA